MSLSPGENDLLAQAQVSLAADHADMHVLVDGLVAFQQGGEDPWNEAEHRKVSTAIQRECELDFRGIISATLLALERRQNKTSDEN